MRDAYSNDIDEMIRMELDNLRSMGQQKSKKKKKQKKKKKAKKKTKAIKIPGYN